MPRVSVFMPSYNHAPYVAAAIRSIQAQSFQNFEIVVTDDGSTDGTPDVIADLREPRLRLHRFAANRGAVCATNDAIRRCTGEYLALLNSDDVFLPHKLERQVAFLDANPGVGAVFGFSQPIDGAGVPLDRNASMNRSVFEVENRSQAQWLRQFFFNGNCLCHPSIMIRRECYDTVGLYDARFSILPDFQMWMRLVAAWPIHVLQEPLIGFRELPNGGNASAISTFEKYLRCAWEDVHVRRCYLDLTPETFAEVFAPEIGALGLSAGCNRTLALGRICVASAIPNLNRLGLELLFEALPADPGEDSGAHADYLRLIETTDVYNLLSQFRIADLERQARPIAVPEVVAPVDWRVPALDKPMINLGCGPAVLPGWFNLDVEPVGGGHVWDPAEGIPFETGSVSIVYSEHFIDRLALPQAIGLLRECHRVLCPGGILRVSTPSLRALIDAYIDGRREDWRDVGWVAATPCDMMNEGMRAWGQQYLFDRERLHACLLEAGFSTVAPAPWRQSSVAALRGLERRPFHGELIFEAQK